MKNKITIVEFPVFGDYLIHVEICSDLQKTVLKYPQTKDVDQLESTNALTVHPHGESFSFIFLKYNSSAGTVAHESWHAIRRMMEHMGIALDSETVAYHLGYLVNRITQFKRTGK
jgi:hypothetical protein